MIKRMIVIFLFLITALWSLSAFAVTRWHLTTGPYTISFTQVGGSPPTEDFNFTSVGNGQPPANGTAVLHTNTKGFVDMQELTQTSGITCDYVGSMTSPTIASGQQLCPTYTGTWSATITQ